MAQSQQKLSSKEIAEKIANQLLSDTQKLIPSDLKDVTASESYATKAAKALNQVASLSKDLAKSFPNSDWSVVNLGWAAANGFTFGSIRSCLYALDKENTWVPEINDETQQLGQYFNETLTQVTQSGMLSALSFLSAPQVVKDMQTVLQKRLDDYQQGKNNKPSTAPSLTLRN